MPFRSNSQRKFLFSQKPNVAAKFAADSQGGVNPVQSKVPAYHALTQKLNTGMNPMKSQAPPHVNMPSSIEDEEKKVKY